MQRIQFTGRITYHLRQSGFTLIDEDWQHNLYAGHWRLYYNGEDGASITTSDQFTPSQERGQHTSIQHDHNSQRVPQAHPLRKNEIYLIPPYLPCLSSCSGAVPHLFVSFEAVGLLGEWSQQIYQQPILLRREPKIVDDCEELIQNVDRPSASFLANALVGRALFHWIHNLTAEYQHSFEHHLNGLGPIANAIEFIDHHFGQDLRIDDLAAMCSYSPDYFRKLFHKSLGKNTDTLHP